MNIQEILTQLNVPIAPDGHHHSRNGWIQVDCIHCSPNTNKFRMGINGSVCNCWTCGPHSLINTLQIITQLPFREIHGMLGGLDRIKAQRSDHTGTLKLPKGLGPLSRAHINYLKGRGFDPDKLVRLWDIRGIGISSFLPWHIWLPVIQRGNTVAWLARSLTDSGRRYFKAPDDQCNVPAGQTLYGLDYARHSVIVNEGPVDAWAVGPGAVAICGLSYTSAQVRMISRFPVRTILFDSQPEAQRRARKLADDLSALPGITNNAVLDTGKDAAEASKREINQVRRLFLR